MARSIFFLGAVLIFSMLISCEDKEIKSQRPNVLMICVDDLNDWIGVMGGHPNAMTPNMDRLAANGVLFANAHCQAPICGPSRASIMTGLRPSTSGIYGQISDEAIRFASNETQEIIFLPEYFKNYGYHTMGKGKIFHDFAPKGVFDEAAGREKGFGPKPEENFKWDRAGTSTDWGAFPEADKEMPDYRTAEWAIEKLDKEYEKPFFLTVGFVRPHVPWYVPQKWFDMHPIAKVQTPPYNKDDLNDLPAISMKIHDMPMMPTTDWAMESGEWQNIVQSYLACVTFVDHYIGKVLTALENSKYKDNTIVVLWSDHGYRLGEKGAFAKHALWQEATKAPLIISVPGSKKGLVRSEAVELLDIYPTLLDLCNLPSNPRNEGKSLRPLMENLNTDTGFFAITSYGRNNHAIVSEQFRYISYEDGSEELYDHINDPNEWYNLAKDPTYQKVIEENKIKLPTFNALWSQKTKNTVNEYFEKQFAEQHNK